MSFIFFTFQIHFSYIVIANLVLIFDVCIYIYIYIYIEIVITVSPISLCVVSFLSLCTCFIFIVCNLLFLFHTKMPWWVLFKVFQKYRLSKSSMPWTLFLQRFSRVCVRVDFIVFNKYELSDLWLLSYFICLLWFFQGLPKGEIVRTYVNYVKNICHLELANPLTKRTLLVIW